MAFKAILTTLGLQRLAEAQADEEPLVFTHVAVGDGNGSAITPDASMTALVNEVDRVTVNVVARDPVDMRKVIIEGLLPVENGGYTIREAGLFNGDGELIAIASFPPIYKPLPSEGSSVAEYIRIPIKYDSVETAVEITVDNSTVMATRLYVDQRTFAGILGDGSDGDLVFDQIATVAGLVPVGGLYTATRDIFADDCSVIDGAELKMNGFRLFVRGTLTTATDGKITAAGADGGTGSDGGGSAGSTGTVLAGAPGGGSGNASAGGNGNPRTGYGGSGGAGGTYNGVGGPHAGGSGGTATAPAAALGSPRMLSTPPGTIAGLSGGVATLTAYAGGGGGGGAGASLTPGAAGGAGGGVLVVAARFLELESAANLFAGGGIGHDAAESNGGGGGGGGGGVLLVIHGGKRPGLSFAAATNCPGGAGGAKDGTGTAGTAGSNGSVFEIDLRHNP